MANATDIEHLQTLEQRELAIIYCERMALAMQSQQDLMSKTAPSDEGDASAV